MHKYFKIIIVLNSYIIHYQTTNIFSPLNSGWHSAVPTYMSNIEFAREYDFEKRRKTLSIVLNLVHFNLPSFNFFKVTISRLVTPQYITKLKTPNIIHKFQQTSCFMSKINLFGPNGGYTDA